MLLKESFFYCNTIISSSTSQSELVKLSLIESYCLCLPILQYYYFAYKQLDS